MSESKDNPSDSSTRTPILQSSRLNPAIRASMLRPSQFSSQLNTTAATEEPKSDALNDAKVNPFLKETSTEELTSEISKDSTNVDKKEEKSTSDPLSLLTNVCNGLPKSNLFVAKASIPLAENSGFVFGQNVHERVTGENIQTTSTTSNATKLDGENSSTSSSTASNLLFSSAIQHTKSDEEEKAPKETDSKCLNEVAREYEESRAQKRKYEEVETFTGEENEVNVVDINCKLFAFVNANWEERGRGSLRLNDSKDNSGCARVVFRTSGNLRLLLNTKIWPDMVAQRPSQKSLRLTAIDSSGQVKIFLIMSRPDDVTTLFNALSERIESCKAASPKDDDEKKNGSDLEVKTSKEVEESGEPSPKKPVTEVNSN